MIDSLSQSWRHTLVVGALLTWTGVGAASAQSVPSPPKPPAPARPVPPIERAAPKDREEVPPSPLVRGFGNNQHWITAESLTYKIGRSEISIVVPRGFVTDFASIPAIPMLLEIGLTPHGQYSRAAIIHDFLYWAQPCSRSQSDRLMVIAMKESGVSWFDENAIFAGVYGGGQIAWNQNAADRKSGNLRVVPDKYQRPEDPNMSWPNYHSLLRKMGLKDPPFVQRPVYCGFGNNFKVP